MKAIRITATCLIFAAMGIMASDGIGFQAAASVVFAAACILALALSILASDALHNEPECRSSAAKILAASTGLFALCALIAFADSAASRLLEAIPKP